jgi:hypothetical protein
MRALVTAREAYTKWRTENALLRAGRGGGVPASRDNVGVGQPVLVYREEKRRWMPGYTCIAFHENEVLVMNDETRTTQVFPSEAVKEARSAVPDFNPGTEPLGLDETEMNQEIGTSDEDHTPDAMHNVILSNAEARGRWHEFGEAIAQETDGLLEKGVFTVVKVADLPKDCRRNVIQSRLILSEKDVGTQNQRKKARLVVRAFRGADLDRDKLLCHAPTASKSSFRIVLALAISQGTAVYTRDVSQAYVSSDAKLARDVYVRPPPELNVEPGVLWKLEKPLYGLPEAGRYWNETYGAFHETELRMTRSKTDACLFCREETTGQRSAIVIQVDDSCGTGPCTFLGEEETASASFPSKARTIIRAGGHEMFNGVRVSLTDHPAEYCCDQGDYIDRLPENIDRSYQAFAAARGACAYISTSTRPDELATTAILSQVTKLSIVEDDFVKLEQLVRRLKGSRNRCLRYRALEAHSVVLYAFSDASFATNADLTSQLGFVIAAVDQNGSACIVHFASRKCHRVTRSVLAAELYAAVLAADEAIALKCRWEEVFGFSVRLILAVDAKTLYDALVNLGQLSEKRLQIDVAATRDAFRTNIINGIAWIPGDQNPADGLTRGHGRECPGLIQIMDSGKYCSRPSVVSS